MIAALLAVAALSIRHPLPSAAAPQPMSAEPKAGGYAVNIAAVYIRRTPSLPGPVIDEEKAHVLFKVISCQGGWCALDLGARAGVGYLPANALQAVPPHLGDRAARFNIVTSRKARR